MREGVCKTLALRHQRLAYSSEVSAGLDRPVQTAAGGPCLEKLVIRISPHTCGWLCLASLLSVILIILLGAEAAKRSLPTINRRLRKP